MKLCDTFGMTDRFGKSVENFIKQNADCDTFIIERRGNWWGVERAGVKEIVEKTEEILVTKAIIENKPVPKRLKEVEAKIRKKETVDVKKQVRDGRKRSGQPSGKRSGGVKTSRR